MFCTRLANGGLFPTGDHIVPFVISPRFECLNKRTHTHRDLCMPCCGDFPLFFPLLYCCQTPLDFVHENVMGTLKCPHNYGEVILLRLHTSATARAPTHTPTIAPSTTHAALRHHATFIFLFSLAQQDWSVTFCFALATDCFPSSFSWLYVKTVLAPS